MQFTHIFRKYLYNLLYFCEIYTNFGTISFTVSDIFLLLFAAIYNKISVRQYCFKLTFILGGLKKRL